VIVVSRVVVVVVAGGSEEQELSNIVTSTDNSEARIVSFFIDLEFDCSIRDS
jgi:hypothetical protein